MEPFSYNLGAFDPIFPGITLHFPTEAVWQQSQSMLHLRGGIMATDMLKENPNLSPHQVSGRRIHDHIAKNRGLANPLSIEESEKIYQGLIKTYPENAVAFLSVDTTYQHERRHFHDWLLSPWMVALTAKRTELCINVMQIYFAMLAEDTNVIPVPLPRWLLKTQEEKNELLEMWQTLLGHNVKIRLPELLKRTEILKMVEHIQRRYGDIGMLFESYGAGLSDSALFEASALLIQIQAVNDFFGPTACNLFMHNILKQDLNSRYPTFFRVMNKFVEPGKMLENDTLTALATWCLLGNWEIDPDNAHPVARMVHLIHYLEEQGFPNLDAPARDIFSALDKACKIVPYNKCLEESVKLNQLICRQNLEIPPGNDAKGQARRAVTEAYEFFCECHRYMVAIFLEDPESYSKPISYLDENFERWLEPPVRFSFGRPFYPVNRADLHKYQGVLLFEDHQNGDNVFLRQYIMQPPKKTVDLKLASNWQFQCSLTDTLFAEFSRDKPEIEYQRDRSRQEGLYLIEVLA